MCLLYGGSATHNVLPQLRGGGGINEAKIAKNDVKKTTHMPLMLSR